MKMMLGLKKQNRDLYVGSSREAHVLGELVADFCIRALLTKVKIKEIYYHIVQSVCNTINLKFRGLRVDSWAEHFLEYKNSIKHYLDNLFFFSGNYTMFDMVRPILPGEYGMGRIVDERLYKPEPPLIESAWERGKLVTEKYKIVSFHLVQLEGPSILKPFHSCMFQV